MVIRAIYKKTACYMVNLTVHFEAVAIFMIFLVHTKKSVIGHLYNIYIYYFDTYTTLYYANKNKTLFYY